MRLVLWYDTQQDSMTREQIDMETSGMCDGKEYIGHCVSNWFTESLHELERESLLISNEKKKKTCYVKKEKTCSVTYEKTESTVFNNIVLTSLSFTSITRDREDLSLCLVKPVRDNAGGSRCVEVGPVNLLAHKFPRNEGSSSQHVVPTMLTIPDYFLSIRSSAHLPPLPPTPPPPPSSSSVTDRVTPNKVKAKYKT